MVVAGSCIGIGIFLTPAFIAEQLPSPGWILMVWLVGGISTLCAAFTFGELASRFPDKAGIYYWLKAAYGDFWGFLFGWFYIIVLVSGAIAAISLGFAQYFTAVFPVFAGQFGQSGVAISLIGFICVVNCIGLKWGDWSTRSLTLLKIGGLILIIGIGLAMSQTSPSLQLHMFETEGKYGMLRGFGLALVGVSFSYAGIQYATFLAAESLNSARNIALAMTLGVLLVIVLYLFTNLAYLRMMPVGEMMVSEVPASAAISAVSPVFGDLIPVIIMISAAGTIAAFTLAAPRMYQSMAADGLFFSLFMNINERFHTPVNAIITQTVCAVFWVLFWGTFAGVIIHLVITNLIFMVMAANAIYILRRRPGEPPGFRAPGYPVVPAIYIGISVYIIVASAASSPLSLVVSAAFAGTGWLIYQSLLKNKPDN